MRKSIRAYQLIFVAVVMVFFASCQRESVQVLPNKDALNLWSTKNATVSSTVLETGKDLPSLNLSKSAIWGLAWSPNGNLLASGSEGGEIIIWEASSGKKRQSFRDSTGPARSLSWSPDGKQLASGGHKITIWEVETGKQLQILTASTEEAFEVALSPDGSKLAALSFDGQATIWDASTGEQVRSLERNLFGQDIGWSPQGDLLATSYPLGAGGHKQVTLWDPETGNAVLTQSRMYNLAWSPIGTTAASVSESGTLGLGDDTTLVLWDIRSGEKIRDINTGDLFFDMDWSPDGRLLVVSQSVASDYSVIVLNAQTGEKIHILKGHTELAGRVAWSPRGDLIASSQDGKIIIWKVMTHKDNLKP